MASLTGPPARGLTGSTTRRPSGETAPTLAPSIDRPGAAATENRMLGGSPTGFDRYIAVSAAAADATAINPAAHARRSRRTSGRTDRSLTRKSQGVPLLEQELRNRDIGHTFSRILGEASFEKRAHDGGHVGWQGEPVWFPGQHQRQRFRNGVLRRRRACRSASRRGRTRTPTRHCACLQRDLSPVPATCRPRSPGSSRRWSSARGT